MLNITTDLTEVKAKYAELKAYFLSLEVELKEEDILLISNLHALFKTPTPVAIIPTPVTEVAPVVATPTP